MTFEEFVKQWFAYYEKRVKVSTLYSREIASKRLLEAWEHYPFSDITTSMYQQHLDDLSTQLSKNYIAGIHTTGKMIFSHAEQLGTIKNNPTKHFEMPRMDSTEVNNEVEEIGNFLDRDELASFFECVQEHGLELDLVLFSTLVYSGVRVGQLVVLKESEVTFKTSEINITKTYFPLQKSKSNLLLLPPKTKGSIRKTEIDPYVIGFICEHIKEQKVVKMKNRKINNDQGFIFADAEGFPCQPVKVRKRLKLNMHITPHSFKHTIVLLLIEAGVLSAKYNVA